MISLDEIDRSILELESRDTTFANCEKLSWLYIVRDHIAGRKSWTASLPEAGGNSDFLKTAADCDPERLWQVLDELMETLRVVNPRLYDGVMRRIAAE